MKRCQQCGGTGRTTGGLSGGISLYCPVCGGSGEIGDATIHRDPTFWPRPQTVPDTDTQQRLADLERRVARIETMQRRKPRRKAGRR